MSRHTPLITSFCAGVLLLAASYSAVAEHGLDEKMSEDSLCAETPEAFNNGKDTKADYSPDLDDPKVLERILGEAEEGIEVGFSGWRRIDHANGKLSSLSQYRDGRLDGLQAGWHENGQKRIRIRMKDGKPDGLCTAWDENGSKIYEFRYNLDAQIFRWHENGQKAYQATYAKDRLVETSWHKNGQQSSKKNYKNFQRDGTWTEWNQTGEILSEVQWKDGRRWDGKWTLMSGDGEYEKRCEIIMKDGSGTRIYYRKNGTVFHRTTFEGGQRVEWIFPPSTTPLDAKDFEGDVAKVLEAMSEQDKKNVAVWPQEIWAVFLEAVKNSIFLKREPKNFHAAGAFEMGTISRQWRDWMHTRLGKHEELHRGELHAESARLQSEIDQTLKSLSLSVYAFEDEIINGQSLKEHREPASVKIRKAKESGATKLFLEKLYPDPDPTFDLKLLAEFTELSMFHFSGYQVTDLTPLAKLSKLSVLSIPANQVTDLAPLAELTNLTELALEVNKISDLTPLAKLSKLSKLSISGNQVTDLTPLAGLTNLTGLTLSRNNISDLTPLTELTNLTELDLRNNPIPLDQQAMLRKALPNCRILLGPR